MQRYTVAAVLIVRDEAPRLRPPFNERARRAAGFTATEIAWLQQI